MVLRVHQIISNQLNSFGIDDLEMLAIDHRLHQMLVNQPPERSPLVPIMHYKKMIALRDELVRDVGMGPVAVDAALAVDDFLDQPAIGDYGHIAIPDLEHV